MNKYAKITAAISLLVLTACSQQTPEPTLPLPQVGKSLGLVEIRFTGVGTPNFKASARNISSDPQSRSLTDVTNGIQLESILRSSFDTGTRGSDGTRYLSATFKLRNAAANCTPVAPATTCSPTPYASIRKNLTFMAVSTASTLNNTAVLRLKKFDGTDANPNIAAAILPTHAMHANLNTALPALESGGEDFQAFSEVEILSLATTLGSAVTSVFPYGFVTRCVGNCTAGTRDLAANPSDTQFDGRVTFAVKMPLQATPSQDPYSFSLMFDASDDSNTRVTQSLEEQNDSSLVTARAAALTGAEISSLAGSALPSICSLRTAGTPAAPSAFLVQAPVRLTATPSLANTQAASGATVTANFTTPMNPGSSSNFTVNGSLTGKRAGTYGATGNDLSFTPSALLSAFPGEKLEVSLTSSLSSATNLKPCQGYTFQYRTAVTTTSSGVFGTASSEAVGTAPISVALGDLDGDAKLDLAVANLDSDSVSILFGNGDGTFQAASSYAVGRSPRSVALGDLNGDGKLDLSVTNYYSGLVSILLGNGDGTFQAASRYAVGTLPKSVAVGDLNGDGKLDLSASKYNLSSVAILFGNGDGTFQAASSYAIGSSPSSVAIGDLNGDGKLDLTAANYNSNTVSVIINDQPVLTSTNSNFSLNTNNPLIARFNLPMSTANSSNFVIHRSMSPNTAGTYSVNANTNKFVPSTAWRPGETIEVSVTNGLLNQNNVALSNPFVFRNYGGGFISTGLLGTATDYPTSASFNGPSAVASADLNNDGKLDVITANTISSDLSIRLGNGTGGFSAPSTLTMTDPLNPQALTVADINNDGKLDILTANIAGNISIFLGNNNGTFQTETTKSTSGGTPRAIAAGDINNDGKLDVVTANIGVGGNITSVLIGNGDGTFQNASSYAVGTNPTSIALGDVNLDGKLDMLTANRSSSNLSLLMGKGNGTFAAATTIALAAGSNPNSVLLVDAAYNASVLDTVHKLDIVTANSGTNDVSVLRGNGDGTFASPANYAVGSSPQAIAIVDIEGNQLLDLVTVNDNATISVLNRMSNFVAVNYALPASALAPMSLAVSDFNNDSRADLVTANFDSDSTSVFLQTP